MVTKTKTKKAVVKKPRAISISRQIVAKIFELCANSNNELMLYEINEAYGYAFIVKKISVTTFYIQNESSFCPVDKYTRKDFLSSFYIVWEDQPEIGCSFIPEIAVKTPQEAEKVILSYEGEIIEA